MNIGLNFYELCFDNEAELATLDTKNLDYSSYGKYLKNMPPIPISYLWLRPHRIKYEGLTVQQASDLHNVNSYRFN